MTKDMSLEEFRSNWLLQIAADRSVKSAAPLAIVLAFEFLNRKKGTCWPSNAKLMMRTGAEAENTIRSALKLLEARGHVDVCWTRGGQKNTNIVTPLVAGKPFKKLKGSNAEDHQSNPSTFVAGTLQLSDAEPLKKLKGTHLIEPSDYPLDGGGALAPAAHPDQLVESTASSSAPEGADDATDPALDGFFDEVEFDDFQDNEKPEDFILSAVGHLPIRASEHGWHRLLAWIGNTYGPVAMSWAAEKRRSGNNLSIKTILDFNGGVADVA